MKIVWSRGDSRSNIDRQQRHGGQNGTKAFLSMSGEPGAGCLFRQSLTMDGMPLIPPSPIARPHDDGIIPRSPKKGRKRPGFDHNESRWDSMGCWDVYSLWAPFEIWPRLGSSMPCPRYL